MCPCFAWDPFTCSAGPLPSLASIKMRSQIRGSPSPSISGGLGRGHGIGAENFPGVHTRAQCLV